MKYRFQLKNVQVFEYIVHTVHAEVPDDYCTVDYLSFIQYHLYSIQYIRIGCAQYLQMKIFNILYIFDRLGLLLKEFI